MEDDDQLESCKVVLLGESGVGKTSIITQFMDQDYQENQVATTGATFSTKSMLYDEIDKEIKFEIWDTAGQEKFRALTKMFYKDASVAILVYDITRPESFDELKEYWSVQVKDNAPANIILAVAANKSDLYENEKVDEKTGREFAASIGAIFKLTSAKSTNGIENLFHAIGMKYFSPGTEVNDNKDVKKEKRQTLKITKTNENDAEKNKQKKKCC